jgi:putative restriction endonuclease
MSDALLARFDNLKTWGSGGQRAPHKPLLVLLALGAWARGQKELKFSDVVEPLTELLRRFGPARKVQHPEQPFWRLQRDDVWEVFGVHTIEMGADGGATKGSLLTGGAVGRFPIDVQTALSACPELATDIARRLLDAHFPSSLHEDILDAVGLELEPTSAGGGGRDPNFRKRVLTAYEHQCAVCGLQLLLSGSSVALEAAHIKWHQAGGPATVPNGICLCVLHHKLFDRGAFTVAPPYTILISDEIGGLAGLSEHLLTFHGKPLRSPIRPDDAPAAAFLHWHRREVFRGKARPT